MNKLLIAFVGVLLAATFHSASVQAQNARSWVSSNGSGTACTRISPCGTFAAAHDATASGGAVHCVDGGDYFSGGTFTITKSLTIDCGGTLGIHGLANIHVSGAFIVVHLRNLLIDGGTLNPAGSSVGVNFINGGVLYIEHCTISGWNLNAAQGIRFTPPSGTTAKLIVLDSTIVDNGNGTVGTGGIYIAPAGSGVARVSIERTKIVGNTYGIYALGTGATGLITAVIKDSFIANNVSNGVSLISQPGSAQVSITMDHSSSVGNGQDGILAQGSNVFGVLTEATVIGNFGSGLHSASGGNIFSYKNNALVGNVTEGSPTAFVSLN
jgi:hypothetical protein